MICEIVGWVLGGVQLGVLVMVLLEPLVMPRAHFIWIGGARVCSLGACAGAALGCAHFCKIGGRVLGMQSGVFAKVLLWDGVWGVL